MSFRNPLDFSYLFSAPKDTEVFGALSTAFFVVALLLALVSGYMVFRGKFRYEDNLLRYTMISRSSRVIFGLSIAGILVFLARALGVSGFDIRLWLWVVVAFAVVQIVRGLIWRVRTYPKAREEWESFQNRETRTRRVAQTAPIAAATTVTKSSGSLTPSTVGVGAESSASENVVDSLGSPRGTSRRGEKRRARKNK